MRSDLTRSPESTLANTLAPAALALNLSDDERNNIEIYQKYSQGVVNISTITVGYDFFFGASPRQSGIGSGAIIDTQGRIVTNYHVISDAERIEVTLPDKTKHVAKVVGSDPNNDLAVIKIDVPRGGVTAIPLGTSKGLQVGQKVLAIGNPYGLDRTLTTGIISSLGRAIQGENGRVIEDMIQTDASINHGNSGGPLLNNQGQIIGINTAILSPSDTGSIGIGFAIPVDTVRRITGDLITIGYVRHPWLGVRSLALEDFPGLSRALRLDTDRGLMIVTVLPNSPAAQGGIRGATQEIIVGNYRVPAGGDVLLALQGKELRSRDDLPTEVDRYKPGDKVTVTILRAGQKMDLPIVLQEAPRQ
ncbi:MAG: hypothetical protein AUG12_03350 [Acidobacteria bacterium 13_1_20CM_2_57_8]|nr:MAG: hypothetical protein AUG12_03350 [Acidobacteria bacterium 13_1_20CM_2_57_8]